jgi:hypothetical protein
VCQKRNRSADCGNNIALHSVFAPRQPRVPQLADKIAAMMESEKISLADLLMGLEEERKAIWQERQADRPQPKVG